MPHGDVHETLEVDAHFAPLKTCTRLGRLSPVIAYGCARRCPADDAARGSVGVEGSDPPFGMPGTASGRADMGTPMPPSPVGSLPTSDPSRLPRAFT